MLAAHLSRFIPVLVAGVAALLPGAAVAESVCIASDATPMYVPGTQESLGTLDARHCYAVMGRDDDRTRIWVSDAGAFQVEVEVANRALAQVLVDDVPMRLSASEEPYGLARSGALVEIEKSAADDRLLVHLLEGRVEARLLVDSDEIYPAESWSEPDPDDTPDAGWPVGTLPLPPGAVAMTQRPSGYDVRAEVGGPLFHTTDVLQDPAFGELRMEFVEQRDYEAKVRVVGRQMWVEGWVTDVDWRADPPEKGWSPTDGVPPLRTSAVGNRQIGAKPANVALEPKGDAVAQVPAGAWVVVSEEEGSWVRVNVNWDGGKAQGWIEKKRLEKEKKQGDPPKPSVGRVAVVDVTNVAVEWFDPEGHDTDPEMSADLIRGFAVDRIDVLKRLYAEAIRTSANLSGEVTTRLVVGSDGVILEQSTPVATLDHAGLRSAVESMVEALPIPEWIPRQRRVDPNLVVWVQYTFKPLGQ